MRYTVPLLSALAAFVSAAAPASSLQEREPKLYTLEIGPDKTVEFTEDEKFQMIDVSCPNGMAYDSMAHLLPGPHPLL